MNRKEVACAAVGAMLSAAGCAPAMRSSTLPVGSAEQNAPNARSASPNAMSPHVTEMKLSLASGTTKDNSSALIYLAPKSGWSIVSDRPKLHVSISDGHVALLEAPQYEKVYLVGTATISHVDGTHFLVRCHIEPECRGA